MGLLWHHVHRAIQDSPHDGEKPLSLHWIRTLRIQWFFHQTLGLRRAARNLPGGRGEENNKAEISCGWQRHHYPTLKLKYHAGDNAITSLYNCIIGMTGMAQLRVACSTSHLKLKYHAGDNAITTLHGYIEAAQRCFLQACKNQNSVSLSERSSKDKGKVVASLLDSNLIQLDPRSHEASWIFILCLPKVLTILHMFLICWFAWFLRELL